MQLGTLRKNTLKTYKCYLQFNLKRNSEAMWKANEVDKYIHKYVLGTRYWHLLTQVITE